MHGKQVFLSLRQSLSIFTKIFCVYQFINHPFLYFIMNLESEVVLRNTRFSPREMYRLSREIVDWASLASLMDLSMAEKEHIYRNNALPDPRSRTEKALSIFSKSRNFCRKKLADDLKEIGLLDLMKVVETGQYRGLEVIQM